MLLGARPGQRNVVERGGLAGPSGEPQRLALEQSMEESESRSDRTLRR